jgi:hypothetical protein
MSHASDIVIALCCSLLLCNVCLASPTRVARAPAANPTVIVVNNQKEARELVETSVAEESARLPLLPLTMAMDR